MRVAPARLSRILTVCTSPHFTKLRDTGKCCMFLEQRACEARQLQRIVRPRVTSLHRDPFRLFHRSRSGFLDRCSLGVDELPAPLLPNEHAGPATLLINRSLLVLSFGGRAIGHDGGIPVAADFNII